MAEEQKNCSTSNYFLCNKSGIPVSCFHLMGKYGVSLRTKINLKKRSDLLGEINSDIKIMYSNKQNVT